MKKHTIKHIHARVGTFNGSLFFLVDNRLLRVGVGTPNFNDYGEWRLDECRLSSEPYNSSENKVELKPYECFEDIEITDKELRMLEFGTKISDVNYKFEDGEFEKLKEEYPDLDMYIAGGVYEGEDCMTFFSYDDDTNEETKIKMSEWNELSEDDKTPFQKVFLPIMTKFREGFLERGSGGDLSIYI